MLVVVAILGILTLCVLRAASGAADRADVVRCMGNLRGLHIALAADLADNNRWPQCPLEAGDTGYDGWWIHELSKYKVVEANWTCPSILRANHAEKQDIHTGKAKIHYIPTNFDENPYTPRRWATQPWLVEIADSHGEGNLMVFPDGAIIGATRFLSQHQ